MSTTFIPVYRDTYYETILSSLTYYVVVDNETIFNGKAVKSPAEEKLRININRIAKDYLDHTIPDFREADGVVYPHPAAFRFFYLYNETGTLLATYGVLFDWEGDFSGSTQVLSDPVRPNISGEMKFPFTIYSPSGTTLTIYGGKIVHSSYFINHTPAIVFGSTGGTAQIHFETDFEPFAQITASATTSGYTIGAMTDTALTITAAPNTSYDGRPGEIVFLFNGVDMGWDRTYVDILRSGSTPVTGITWTSGDTVTRPCWKSLPFEDELIVPGDFLTFGTNTAAFSNASCVTNSPYTFSADTDWVHFVYEEGFNPCGYSIYQWNVNFFCDDNTTASARTATITTYENGLAIKTTTLTQQAGDNIYSGQTIEPYGGPSEDYLLYSHKFIELGPFDRNTSNTEFNRIRNSFTLRYSSTLSANRVFPDGSRDYNDTFNAEVDDAYYNHPIISKRYTIASDASLNKYFTLWTKVPANILSGSFNTGWLAEGVTSFDFIIPSSVKAIYNFSIGRSDATVYYEGSLEEWRKVYKYNFTVGNDKDYPVYCTDGTGYTSSKSSYLMESAYPSVCADCGFAYEYPKNSGDPTSRHIIYSASDSGLTSGWTARNEYNEPIQQVAHTFTDGNGVITYSEPPYILYLNESYSDVESPCLPPGLYYLGSGSLRELYNDHNSSPYLDHRLIDLPLLEVLDGKPKTGYSAIGPVIIFSSNNLPPHCDEDGPSGTTAVFNNLLRGNFIFYQNYPVLSAPNAREVRLELPWNVGDTKLTAFLPSVQQLEIVLNSGQGIKELTIGPMLRTMTVRRINTSTDIPLGGLTEINFNAPSYMFYIWLDEHRDILNKITDLTTIHTLDADITSW